MAAEDKTISDLTVVASTGGAEFTEVVKGSGNFKRKNNMTASAAPTVTDDSASDYSIGSLWHYNGAVWVCRSSSAGAAVWVRMGAIESSTLDVSIADGVATVDGISGTWTPVASDVINDAIVTLSNGIYSRTGNVVTAGFGWSIELDASQLSTEFTVNLPIPSTFTSGSDLFGSIMGTFDNGVQTISDFTIRAAGSVLSVSNFSALINGGTFEGTLTFIYIIR